MFSLNEAVDWLPPGTLLHGDGSRRVFGVSTDSRTLQSGDLFVTLRGDSVDGRSFIPKAIQAGAAAVLCEAPLDCESGGLPYIVVPDACLAMALLSARWRSRFALPLIAVTGSNGKTTVKGMLAAIMSACFEEARVISTIGNSNNHIGVPLTLFRLSPEHLCAVVEMGSNHPGEIEFLSRIAKPTISLITNAQREHQEFFHTVEGSAQENGSSITELGQKGIAVFPGDDACSDIWRDLAGDRTKIEFGLVSDPSKDNFGAADSQHRGNTPYTVWALASSSPENFYFYINEFRWQVQLSVLGKHNVRNALAAAAAAYAAGVDGEIIAKGLSHFSGTKGRLSLMNAKNQAVVIDDTYNANPDSVIAAIDLLSEKLGHRVFVLGDMAELGDLSTEFHAEAGRYAREKGINSFFGLGSDSLYAVNAFNEQRSDGDPLARSFSDMSELIKELNALSRKDVVFLVKGSRFMRMEQIVQSLSAVD